MNGRVKLKLQYVQIGIGAFLEDLKAVTPQDETFLDLSVFVLRSYRFSNSTITYYNNNAIYKSH